MGAPNGTFVFTRGKVIFDYAAQYCETPEKLLRSELFGEVVARFVDRTAERGTSTFAYLQSALPGMRPGAMADLLVNLFRLLASHTAEELLAMNGRYARLLADRDELRDLIEELYNFWRRFERFFYIEAPRRSEYTKSRIHHAQFIKASEEFKDLVLYVYRRVAENLTEEYARVYRQLPAGANMGMLIERMDWDAPPPYRHLLEIPFIRLALLEPPLILYPTMSKRQGRFEEVPGVGEDSLRLDPSVWFCYPAKVGELTAFIFFHRDFLSLGLALVNLFEIADYAEIAGKRPDLMLIFGLDRQALPGMTVFYQDHYHDMIVGLVAHGEEVDYFGYFKKMTLTLHNISMLKKGRLPVHGAMVCVKLKDGRAANIVIVGDSGTGKSETIEALRALSEEHICEMRIVFDDMGALGRGPDGGVLGYGTEIGAFVRLDDLQPGYAYDEIDRSIFMNPDKTNARLIMPVAQYRHIVRGIPVDACLYANNYEQVDEEHPVVEFFETAEQALQTFRSGARFAKGTTDEKGLVHTFFANPFGAPQRREDYDRVAGEYFGALFDTAVPVGQIRTRLGIDGFEQEGPRAAALQLFEIIRSSGGRR